MGNSVSAGVARRLVAGTIWSLPHVSGGRCWWLAEDPPGARTPKHASSLWSCGFFPARGVACKSDHLKTAWWRLCHLSWPGLCCALKGKGITVQLLMGGVSKDSWTGLKPAQGHFRHPGEVSHTQEPLGWLSDIFLLSVVSGFSLRGRTTTGENNQYRYGSTWQSW